MWPELSLEKGAKKDDKGELSELSPHTLSGINREIPHYPSFRIIGKERKMKPWITVVWKAAHAKSKA